MPQLDMEEWSTVTAHVGRQKNVSIVSCSEFLHALTFTTLLVPLAPLWWRWLLRAGTRDACLRPADSSENQAAQSMELARMLESAREALANASASFREHGGAAAAQRPTVTVASATSKSNSYGFQALQQVRVNFHLFTAYLARRALDYGFWELQSCH